MDTPEQKTKVNYWKVSTLVLTFILAVLGGLDIYLWMKLKEVKASFSRIQAQNLALSSKITSAPTMVPSEKEEKYDGKFISFSYPSNWYKWAYGRGVSLDYFQINTVPQSDELNPNRVAIYFDIQTLGYTQGDTIDAQEKTALDAKRQYPNGGYMITRKMIDGIEALVVERGGTMYEQYDKTVWLRKNNVKYIITMTVYGQDQNTRDEMVKKYNPVFDGVLNSVKLKYVDPAEVVRLGNHPD